MNAFNPQEVKTANLGLWLPEPGDSLSQTLTKVYGVSELSTVFDELMQLHLRLNPDVFSANRPLEKKVIYLADLHLTRGAGLKGQGEGALLTQLAAQKAGLAGSKQNLDDIVSRSPVEVEAMRFVLGFNQVMGSIGTGIGIGIATVGTLTGQHLMNDIKDFNRWGLDKADMAKRGGAAQLLNLYDARADDVVKKIEKRLGPTKRFLFNGTGVKDALYQGVPQSLRPNPVTISAAKRVQELASSARVGGIAMLAVDAILTCQKLSATEQGEKVKTAYSEIGGIVGSLIAGAGIGIAVTAMSTPMGWVGALVLSTAGAIGGKDAGQAMFDKGFKAFGDVLGIENGALLQRWCK